MKRPAVDPAIWRPTPLVCLLWTLQPRKNRGPKSQLQTDRRSRGSRGMATEKAALVALHRLCQCLPTPAGPYRTNRRQHHHATSPELVELSTIGTSIAILHRPRRQSTLKTATFQQKLTCFFAPRIYHYHSSCEGCPSLPQHKANKSILGSSENGSAQKGPQSSDYTVL